MDDEHGVFYAKNPVQDDDLIHAPGNDNQYYYEGDYFE